MHPGEAFLVDELVEGQLQLLNELEEAAVLIGGARRALDVGGTAGHVVGRGGASDDGVETGAAVAAADVDGLAVCLAQGVEDIPDKAVDVVGLLHGGQAVIDAEPVGRGGTDELAYGEILHGAGAVGRLGLAHDSPPFSPRISRSMRLKRSVI